MVNRERDRTSQTDRSSMDDDDMVRGRSDEMDEMSNDSDELDETEDLDEADEGDEDDF